MIMKVEEVFLVTEYAGHIYVLLYLDFFWKLRYIMIDRIWKHSDVGYRITTKEYAKFSNSSSAFFDMSVVRMAWFLY